MKPAFYETIHKMMNSSNEDFWQDGERRFFSESGKERIRELVAEIYQSVFNEEGGNPEVSEIPE